MRKRNGRTMIGKLRKTYGDWDLTTNSDAELMRCSGLVV